MYLSELEEIVAYVACIAIVIGFGVSTYMEIKNTISEEKEKHLEQKENEEKIKTLISYFNTKKKLLDNVTKLKQTLNQDKTKK
ncbi:hypothetical protein N8902_01940 [Flavobacteriaceae bacterium]|nr:hypothetical protein [Flavobacteriaceae bacterium]